VLCDLKEVVSVGEALVKRLTVTVRPEKDVEIRDYAKELGLGITKYASMCLVLGHRVMVRQVDPEKFIPAELAVEILQRFEAQRDG
jgi:hypothetical protein